MKLPFDKVYCLHLAEAKDRYENCLKEFKRLGIEDQVEFWWTVRFPDIFDKKFENDNFSKGALACALNHYQIIKTVYTLGYNNCLIMEDDAKFIENLYLIENAFNEKNFPTDWDCLKFYRDEEDRGGDTVSFTDVTSEVTWTMICLAFNRNFMKKYIEYMDNNFVFADHIFGCGNEFMKKNNLKVYALDNKIINNWEFERLINYETTV